jgi:hypothetical protein
MDGWGSLTMLIKRQEAAKFRKAILRAELRSRKESHLQDVYNSKDEFDFPEISNVEMKKLKNEIRSKYRRERALLLLTTLMLLLLIVIAAFLMF